MAWLAALGALALPATARADVLVSNIEQVTPAGVQLETLQTPRGLQFTTGDNVDGYDLENIELKVDEYENARVTVELYSVVSGNPGSSLFEFDNPASGITANAVNRFAAPANITLKGSNTIYMIVVTGANDPDASSNKFSLSYTIEDAEDQGGATNSEGDADWAIQDTGHFSVAGVWHTAARPMQIRVNGAAVTTPERALALVSNLEEGGHADVQISEPHAQAFTTGSNAAGYTLTGVAVVAAATTTATAMTAQVCATDGSAHPTTPCTDLAVPASFDPGTVSLAAPANTTLANDTTYAVVLRDSPEMTYTGQNSQAAAHAGWSIANTALAFHAGSSEWRLQSNTWSFRMAIQGYATPLVSNIAQADTSATATDVPRSQGFTTGLNAAGYTLTGVDIVSTVAASSTLFAVAVCETDTSGHPTATCTDFTAPDGHAAGRVAFAAPAAITTLAHDTTYAVVVRGGEDVGATTSTDEDPGGAAAWRIADRFASYDDVADAWQDSAGDESLRIAIPGHVAAGTGCTPDTAAGDIWCGVVTVAELKAPADVTIGYGFSETQGGGLPETMFPVGGNRYTIAGVAVGAGGGSGRLSFALKTALPDADRAKLVLHVDGVSRPFAFDDNQTTTGAAAGYLWDSRTGLDWSSASTVTLRLRPRTLGIGDARAPEAGDMTFAATLSATSTAPVTAIWTASIGSGDTAVLADLGTTTTGMVNVPVGATTTTFTVVTAEDGAVESDETFTVTLSDVSSNATLRTATATGTITNDDNATLSIADAEGGEDEGVEFELTLSAAAQQDVTVDWTASIGSGDTAVAADLGAPTTDMVVVPAGATTTTFTVPVNDDNIYEDDETFTVTLSNPTPASLAQLAADPAATGTIDDNENPPMVSFEQASYTAAEGGSAVDVELTMTSALPDLVYVTLTAEHGAGATAEDYEGIRPGGRATFLAGRTRLIFNVTAFDDVLDEADETVTLGFTIPAAFSGLTQGSVSETTLTLTDNDEPPTVTVADGAATEGDAVEFVATLSAASGLEVTVNYATSVGTDQTATSGTDFTAAPSGTLTIDAGDGAGTISIDTATDDDDEGAETFTLTISSPTNATLGTQTAATGTIEDPVPVTLPTLSVADAAGTEADGVQFTATLSEAGTEQVTATWTASIGGGDTAVAADLGATTTAMVVVPAGATTTTFTVATADDADAETDETFTVTLSAPSSNAELADATATGTIVDDDADTALVGIAVNGVGIPGFFADDDAPQHGVPAATSTAAVLATAASPSAVVASTADVHDVELRLRRRRRSNVHDVTVTVTVTDKGETDTWDLGVNRAVTDAYGWKADSDFDTLKLAGIGDPRGIWYDEDTATFYVGDFGDGKVYAFNPDGTRDAGKDFDVSSFPNGIWSDGTTLWVADSSVEKLRAYTLAGVRDADEDFDTLAAADNEDPRDLWSDGTTMWVADKDDAKIYAYKVSDKSRDADEDFDTLDAAGNDSPRAIWSDGTTMWVADSADAKVYAYKVSDQSRDSDKDFDTLAAAGNDNPRALWSHGTVLWTSDDDDDKLYAYNLPAASTPPPVNNAPVFDSSSTFGADENQRTAGTVRASDGDSGDDVTGYAITGGADQGRFSIGSTSGALTFDSAPDYEGPDDADADGRYLVTVEASSGTGAREMTATQTITVTVDDVDEQPDTPASPTLQPVTGSTTSLAASWAKPGLNGGPDITDYDVRYREGTSGGWTDLSHNGDGRTATIGALTADTAYQAQVRADNGELESDWSDASDAVRTNPEEEATAPDAPGNLTATAAGETRIDLDWDAPADDGGAAVTGYRIEVSVDAGASFEELATTGGSVTRYTHTGLSADETRHYRVVAVNAEGDSPASAIVGATTDEEPEPEGNEPSVIRTYWIGSGGSNDKSGCAGAEEFRAYWNPPQKNQGNNRTYKVADAWEADVTLSGGASGLAYTIQDTGGDPERPELTGSVRIDGNGYVSMRVRGRFGADGWGGWSPTSSLYCRAAAPGAWVDGALLGLTWATPRDGFAAPDGGDFAVRVDGAPVAVTDAALAGAHALLTLAAPVLAGQSVAVDYLASAMHPLADTAGVPVPAWTDLAATNVTGAGPDLGWAAVLTFAATPRAAVPGADAPLDFGPAGASLSLAGTGLADANLAALAAAGPRRLDLSGNGLTDVSALADLDGLARLDLSGNALADLAPLSTLTALRRLDLRGNRVADLAPLASLPRLEVLLLDGNRIADIGALTHLGTLEHLGLSNNAIMDLAPLSDLWSLRRLDLGGNPARDLSPLGDLGTLEWLRVPAANGGVPAHRLVRLRWLWTGPAGVCLGCAEEHEAR